LLLVVVALGMTLWDIARRPLFPGRDGRSVRVAFFLWFIVAYVLIMAPWFVRNLAVVGTPLPTASAQTMWLTNYDDLYSYGEPLSLRTYLSWGWGNILLSKAKALWLNAQTLLAAGWSILLAPIGLIGAWRLRHRRVYRPAFFYGILLYGTMSLVFTFPGWRGGMLHSTVALLPTLYAVAIEGLDAGIAWVASRRRHWRIEQAQHVLGAGLVALSVLLGAWLYLQGMDRYRGEHLYDRVSAWMHEHLSLTGSGADLDGPRVMVNDSPTFYYHSRLPALSIPNASVDTVLTVMERFDVDYVLLDGNYVPLRALYEAPQADKRLALLATFADGQGPVYLYRLNRETGP